MRILGGRVREELDPSEASRSGNDEARRKLERQVRRARRRLDAQRLVYALGWCWFATLLAALVLIAAGKFRPLGVSDWVWGAGALGLGLLAAVVWTVVTGRDSIHAAIEIDRRFSLGERVSSALAMSSAQRQSEAGQALIGDAAGRVERIDVCQRFGITARRQLLLPLLPALVVVLVALLVAPAVMENPAEAKTDEAAIQKKMEQSSANLRRSLSQRRQEAREKGLKEAEQLFQKLEEGTESLVSKSQGDRKKVLGKLNDLAQQIQKRRKELGGADKVKQQLNQMRDFGRGPANRFAKAISRGDFGQAMKELAKLKAELDRGNLSDDERKKLAEQLDKMKDKLKNLVDAHKAAQDDLKKRIDQQRRAGRDDQADKLQEQLDKLCQQSPQMNQLGQLADRLGKCSRCLDDGQLADAAEMMGNLEASLSDLREQLQELEMLDDAMGQLAQCRDQMNGL